MTTPLVAIVGRPNVGKSTLFNRLLHRRRAIVEDVPGVTRDRLYADTTLEDRPVTLVDTGGFVPEDGDSRGDSEALEREVREQAQVAVEACDLVLFVVDGRAGRTAADEEVARLLRVSERPVLLVVNKVDGGRGSEALASEFFRLGMDPVLEVSAEHGRGIDALIAAIVARLPPAPEAAEVEASAEGADAPKPLRVAIVGRPNVGKSTLVNALLGEKRLITSPIAGTTRDAIDTELLYRGGRIVLTDTAGIRRKSALSQRVERFAVLSALKAIDRSDVAVLVLDATEPAVDQDAHLAGIALEKGKALLIAVNKWDLVRAKGRDRQGPKGAGAGSGSSKGPHQGVDEEAFRAELKWKLDFVAFAPCVFLSALEGQKVEKVLEVASHLHAQTTFRAPTPQLNRLLEHISTEHPAPTVQGRPLRLYYVAQVAVAPPTFRFIANTPHGVPEPYRRYITNQLRATFDLRVPIRLLFKERPGRGKREAKVAAMKSRRQHQRRAGRSRTSKSGSKSTSKSK